jgi:hypothetical protein
MALQQTKNTVKVIGRLKSKELRLGVTKGDNPKPYIGGNIVVEVKNDHGVQNLRVDFFNFQYANSGAESKVYTQLAKVNSEYQEGEMIEVSASIEPNTYYNKKTDDVVDGTNLKGFWVKRMESEIQTARAEFEGVISNPQPQQDGTLIFDLLGFTYNTKPIKQTITVPADKVAIFKKGYRPNQTAVIKFEILKGVAVETQEETDSEDLFGDNFSMGTVTKYLNMNILTGGLSPAKSTQLNPTEVQQALNAKLVELETILNEGRAKNNTPAVNSSDDFGTGFDTDDFGGDDMDEDMPW